MQQPADIISLADRARRRLAHSAPPVVTPTPVAAPPPDHRPRLAPVAFLVVLCGCVVVGLVGLFAERVVRRDVERLAPSDRAAIVARARVELRETCAPPVALAGPLHDHCVETATFVLLFPECDAACAQTARALLPQARK